MYNIWYLLLYSINISLVAVLILLLKYIFRDLLSARWQYGIWFVLLLRMAVPFSSARYIFIPAPDIVETLKMAVETKLSSAFTDVYSLINVSFPLPFINGKPVSITDWLFVIYIVGVILSALGYFLSYIRLRFILRKGTEADEETRREIKYISDIYSLRVPERIVYVKGLPSAFICGIIKPVLALDEERETDGKIILHELIHLKYADTLQNTFWCLLRCLNWYNPLMQYTFSRINNDIEALCDRRVLEILSGEERRDYGTILLKMVNERYQKVPCTSSLSNGGKNISRRISSIVKFKKYPKGMGLVCVCIGIMLLVPCLYGSASEIGTYRPVFTEKSFNLSVASARNARCTTVAGAIDTYAKAIAQKNGIMLLSALPEEKHPEIIAELQKNINEPIYYYDTGIDCSKIDTDGWQTGYLVYDLFKTAESSYSGKLGFSLIEENEKEYEKYLIIPIEIEYENGWVITETGESYTTENYLNGLYTPNLGIYEAFGAKGKLKYAFQSSLRVNNQPPGQSYSSTITGYYGSDLLSDDPILNAQFSYIFDNHSAIYEIDEDKKEICYGKSLSLELKTFDKKEEYKEFEEGLKTTDQPLKNYIRDSIGDHSNSSYWKIDHSWDGSIREASGGGFGSSYVKIPDDLRPYAVKVWIFSGSEVIDEFTLFTKGEAYE